MLSGGGYLQINSRITDKDMKKDKTSCPDNFMMLSYHRYSDMVEDDLMRMLESWMNFMPEE